ncbi:PD-(D/E)XK nuclease family protein [Streptomyces buecherae]|uniref:PD-(D/E)XK nuclease family protein n=1 Tax=Streptomyces buecherae TaxID=2763006 RepID=UPI00364B1943
MNDSWLPPEGVHRASDVITVSASMFKRGDFRCPMADALTARGFRPRQSGERRPETLEHFTLAPFMAASDAQDPPRPGTDSRRGRPVPVLHDGLRRWTEHAVARYREAFAGDADEGMVEVSIPWVYRYRPPVENRHVASEYRFTVWGRRLSSADGSLRELRLPVNRMRQQPPPVGFVAAAALVLAEAAPGPKPHRVRIAEVSLLDGCVRTLFDDTREAALSLYREHGPETLSAILGNQEYRPGTSCASCSYAVACPALRRAPGLLGVATGGRPRRTWSVTNGRNYRACPARDHLRRLHLPTADAVERDPTSERGRALHAYLAAQHDDRTPRPCTPEIPERWVPGGFELPEHERALGRRLLRRHAAVCPMRHVRDGTDVRNEPRVVRLDTTADVVVIAAPDLLYRDGDSWVWRETKTTASERTGNVTLLERYPQLALAVLLLARGDLGGTPHRSRVELEVLRPSGADLELIDPFARATRTAAECIVHALVADWHRDDHYAPSPGRACQRCEVAQWCSSALTSEAAA